MRGREAPPGGRHRDRDGGDRAGEQARQDRARIAQAAARLIVDHGLGDWALAKRKAARGLSLPEATGLPSNDEVEAALVLHQSLFGGEAHQRSLRAQRQRALEWMERLAAWHPLLVGSVAAGWAGAHADVRIELAADDAKEVEILLAGRGIAYRSAGGQAAATPTVLLIDLRDVSIRIEILTPNDRRHRARADSAARLDAAALRALLDASGS